MRQAGFTILEAVVSIALFSLIILGATIQLRAYEDGQRSIADALILVKTSRTFLTELSQVSRINDSFNVLATASGVVRPDDSVLDAFNNGTLVTVQDDTAQANVGFDFLTADTNSHALNADLANFVSRWTRPDVNDPGQRSRLQKRIGNRADRWQVRIINPASGAYRVIELHLDDNGSTNLQWPICCK